MGLNKLSSDWIFSNFPKYHIRFWTDRLEYGSFMRSPHNQSKEGDSFQIWFNYKDVKELIEILERLSINLKEIPDNISKKNSLGRKNFSEELKISDLPKYEQPQYIKIDKIPCFCWIDKGRVLIRISGSKDGNFYNVTEVDFRNCIKLEKIIEQKDLSSHISREYVKSPCCISKETYPEFYEI
ncbi:hypothetical protein GTQ40_02265 [Flavobacteriaceae bacterium R38]|nr:hypothetical protein [Flavobacteriaceae bacterium R38]